MSDTSHMILQVFSRVPLGCDSDVFWEGSEAPLGDLGLNYLSFLYVRPDLISQLGSACCPRCTTCLLYRFFSSPLPHVAALSL